MPQQNITQANTNTPQEEIEQKIPSSLKREPSAQEYAALQRGGNIINGPDKRLREMLNESIEPDIKETADPYHLYKVEIDPKTNKMIWGHHNPLDRLHVPRHTGPKGRIAPILHTNIEQVGKEVPKDIEDIFRSMQGSGVWGKQWHHAYVSLDPITKKVNDKRPNIGEFLSHKENVNEPNVPSVKFDTNNQKQLQELTRHLLHRNVLKQKTKFDNLTPEKRQEVIHDIKNGLLLDYYFVLQHPDHKAAAEAALPEYNDLNATIDNLITQYQRKKVTNPEAFDKDIDEYVTRKSLDLKRLPKRWRAVEHEHRNALRKLMDREIGQLLLENKKFNPETLQNDENAVERPVFEHLQRFIHHADQLHNNKLRQLEQRLRTAEHYLINNNTPENVKKYKKFKDYYKKRADQHNALLLTYLYMATGIRPGWGREDKDIIGGSTLQHGHITFDPLHPDLTKLEYIQKGPDGGKRASTETYNSFLRYFLERKKQEHLDRINHVKEILRKVPEGHFLRKELEKEPTNIAEHEVFPDFEGQTYYASVKKSDKKTLAPILNNFFRRIGFHGDIPLKPYDFRNLVINQRAADAAFKIGRTLFSHLVQEHDAGKNIRKLFKKHDPMKPEQHQKLLKEIENEANNLTIHDKHALLDAAEQRLRITLAELMAHTTGTEEESYLWPGVIKYHLHKGFEDAKNNRMWDAKDSNK